MLKSKVQAHVFALLLLVSWTTSAWSSHKHTSSTAPVIIETNDDGSGGSSSSDKSTSSLTSAAAIDVSHPYFRMLCGMACDNDTQGDKPSNFRARFVLPFIPLPLYFTGRFAVHTLEENPTWSSSYSASDWTAAGGVEMPLGGGMSLWAEVSRATSIDSMGCGSACMVSSSTESNFGMNIVRIGFVMRN
jgi:hypothetical protein